MNITCVSFVIVDRHSNTRNNRCNICVDMLMGVSVQIKEDCNSWETHVSCLNEGKYPSLYESFIKFVESHPAEDRIELTFDQFRFMMQKAFLAYRLLRGE